ncbi:MAG: polymorphic toxin-type HINT domain-containing protein [Pirellula sp.]
MGPDGTTELLEGTTVHPIWSVDRNDWIQLSDLQEGERLQAADGIATVVSIAIVSTNVPVYNIEVHGEHVYQVGELGVLVHNTCGDDILQTGGHTILKSTARALNEFHDMSLHSREWGRSLEQLKKYEGLRNDHHGMINRAGDYLDDTGNFLGNLLDYL